LTTREFSPVARRRLYQEIAERIAEEISKGRFVPGDRPPSERDLMQQFGVGRPAIREAMQALDQMGLIAVSHGERARVAMLDARSITDQVAASARHLLLTSPKTLEHLKDARLFFEVGMVRKAAEVASDEDIERLRNRPDDHIESLSALDRFLEMDKKFHREIARINGNPIFEALSQAVFEWLEEFHVEVVRVQGAEQLTLEEHRAILDAIADHDSERAGDAMKRHLTRANALYRRYEIGF
jgi:DNA-binding FadR family transcriptional regulator